MFMLRRDRGHAACITLARICHMTLPESKEAGNVGEVWAVPNAGVTSDAPD